MSDLESSFGNTSSKEGSPVMCCHPAGGGLSAQLVRGAAPSTPRRRRKERRRMSVKKYFRVTPEEDAAIAASAAEVGLEQSSYLRVQALGKAKVRKYRRKRADWDELRRCMGVINKAGSRSRKNRTAFCAVSKGIFRFFLRS